MLIALAALSGCDGARDPEVVGVVTARQRVAPTTDRYTLSDGQQIAIEYNETRELIEMSGPNIGDLLLLGRDGQGGWYAALHQHPGASCYILESSGRDAGDFIVFSIGFRLPKAPDFDPGGITDGQFQRDLTPFCVDAQGRVVRYGL